MATRLEDNYAMVLDSIKRAGKDGLPFHQIAQEFNLDAFVVVGCVRRGINEGRLYTSLDGTVRYRDTISGTIK